MNAFSTDYVFKNKMVNGFRCKASA